MGINREIEHELTANIVKTLLELGTGFAFIGNQYRVSVSDEDYYIDLLLYNTKLRCYVVVDNPTIGILLCKSRDKLTVEK